MQECGEPRWTPRCWQSGGLFLLMDLILHLLEKVGVAQLVVGHVMNVACVLPHLPQHIFFILGNDDGIAIESDIATTEFFGHLACSMTILNSRLGPNCSIGTGIVLHNGEHGQFGAGLWLAP